MTTRVASPSSAPRFFGVADALFAVAVVVVGPDARVVAGRPIVSHCGRRALGLEIQFISLRRARLATREASNPIVRSRRLTTRAKARATREGDDQTSENYSDASRRRRRRADAVAMRGRAMGRRTRRFAFRDETRRRETATRRVGLVSPPRTRKREGE